MTSKKRIPVACTLTPAAAAGQVGEWEELQSHVLRTEPIAGGTALMFAPALADRVEDLAAREAACCAFLSLTVHDQGEELRLEITSADPEAAPVIAMLAGTAPE